MIQNSLEPEIVHDWDKSSSDYENYLIVYNRIKSNPMSITSNRSFDNTKHRTKDELNGNIVNRAAAAGSLEESLRSESIAVTMGPEKHAKLIKTIILESPYDLGNQIEPILWEGYQHECVHWNRAKERGFEQPFFVFFFINSLLGLSFRQAMSPGKIPDSMTDSEYRLAVKYIIEGPSTLSSSDKYMLS